ncbi:MAG: chromosome partitioning protein ParB [Gemmatimonadales bacterium]|nr:MAG: chromosome partitioning protein ParB [Gemmatimonadales bacterium]
MSQAPNRRLGRGLAALLGPSVLEQRQGEELRRLGLKDILPNPFQPRREFSEEALAELTESMRESGLLQPIVVRPASGGRYELIAGARRCQAAKRLGWETIDALVRDVDDRTALTLALVENLQRDALSPIEEAKGYERLIREFGATQEEVAGMVGRARSTVANALRLLQLPEEVQELLHSGKLSAGHARALLSLKSQREMVKVARLAVERGLAVRELEDLARTAGAGRKTESKRARRRVDPEVQRIEDRLRKKLQTDVFVVLRGKGGKISISFYSADDLLRLVELILGEEYA